MVAVRSPAVAGQFYPGSREECQAQIEDCLAEADRFGPPVLPPELEPIGGIAPHAGWICSGAVAAQIIRILALGRDPTCPPHPPEAHASAGGQASCPPADESPETFVVFGAVHRPIGTPAAVYHQGAWETPLGQIAIDEELARRVVQSSPLVPADPEVHEFEHSIEVEVPFIQYLAPSAKLLPVMVSPSLAAPAVGRTVAQAAEQLGRRVVFLGSTDLTHYGPRYRFAPQGDGPEGLRWAKEVNDQRILELVTRLQAEEAVREAAEHRNACGPGAIAATIAAAQTLGATIGHVIRHTNSSEVLCGRYGEMNDAVGYAGVVLGRRNSQE